MVYLDLYLQKCFAFVFDIFINVDFVLRKRFILKLLLFKYTEQDLEKKSEIQKVFFFSFFPFYL